MKIFESDLIEQNIELDFTDKDLLQTCFTHISYANEFHVKSNENLEFLGDSILGFVIAEYLFENFDNKFDEGDMSQIRSRVVCTESLLEVSRKLKLPEHLLAVNQKPDDGSYNQKQYANIVEALIAGIFIDCGLKRAKAFILKNFEDKLKAEIKGNSSQLDYKTMLQELVQKKTNSQIEYKFVERTGEDHDPHFIYSVEIDGKEFGRSEGSSKKEAQSKSAKLAIDAINKRRKKI